MSTIKIIGKHSETPFWPQSFQFQIFVFGHISVRNRLSVARNWFRLNNSWWDDAQLIYCSHKIQFVLTPFQQPVDVACDASGWFVADVENPAEIMLTFYTILVPTHSLIFINKTRNSFPRTASAVYLSCSHYSSLRWIAVTSDCGDEGVCLWCARDGAKHTKIIFQLNYTYNSNTSVIACNIRTESNARDFSASKCVNASLDAYAQTANGNGLWCNQSTSPKKHASSRWWWFIFFATAIIRFFIYFLLK